MTRSAKTRKAAAAAKSTRRSTESAGAIASETWDFRLYVAGHTPRSQAALVNLKRLCEEHIPGRYRIEIIDLIQNPQLAAGDQILAIPTLVRKLPAPLRKIVGDLRDTERAIVGLQLRAG